MGVDQILNGRAVEVQSATVKDLLDAGAIETGSLNTGRSEIDGVSVPGYQIPIQNVTNDADHHSEPHPIQVSPTELLVVDRVGDSHTDNNAKQVGRIYDLEAETWNSPFDIVDDSDWDDRNTSLIHDPDSGRLVLIYRTSDAATNDTQAIYKVESNVDSPTEWSSREDITGVFSSALKSNSSYLPFGDGVQTSKGLMTLIYNMDGYVEAVFSTDGGQTWGSPTEVIDSSGFSLGTAKATESVPVAITDDKIVVIGRNNETNHHYAVRSTDGGATWESDYWNVHAPSLHGNSDVGLPVWVKRTGEFVTAIWGDRHDETMYAAQMSADRFWKNPATLALEPAKPIFEDFDNGDWGYPIIAPLGPRPENLVAAWYSNRDAGGSPDLYFGTLPANLDGSGTKLLGGGTLEDFDRGLREWQGATGDFYVDATAPTFDGQQSLKIDISASDTGLHKIHKVFNLPRYARRGDTIRWDFQLEQSADEVILNFFQQTALSQGSEERYFLRVDADSDQLSVEKRTQNRNGSFSSTVIDSTAASISSHLGSRLTAFATPQKDGWIDYDLHAGATELAFSSGQDFEFVFGGIGFYAKNNGTSNATTLAFGSPKVL